MTRDMTLRYEYNLIALAVYVIAMEYSRVFDIIDLACRYNCRSCFKLSRALNIIVMGIT